MTLTVNMLNIKAKHHKYKNNNNSKKIKKQKEIQ